MVETLNHGNPVESLLLAMNSRGLIDKEQDIYLGVADATVDGGQSAQKYGRVYKITAGGPTRGTILLDATEGPQVGAKVQFVVANRSQRSSTLSLPNQPVPTISFNTIPDSDIGMIPAGSEVEEIENLFLATSENGFVVGPPDAGALQRPWACNIPGASYKPSDGVDFQKQLKIFATSGCGFSRLTLWNGEVIVQGDCIEIDRGEDFSGTSSPGEKWIAEVTEIKGESRTAVSSKRWVKYLRKYKVTVGNLSSCEFGRNELVLSNHEQIIAADTIRRRIQVKFFNESATDQEPIGWNDKWYRYILRTGTGATDNRLVLHGRVKLPPARCGVPTCRKRYDPTQDRQRFCPREDCQIWYHTQCLENVLFQKISSKCFTARLSMMLNGLPEFDDVPNDFFQELERNSDRKGRQCRFPQYEVGSISNVVWCAQTPISRGCGDGIVGNEDIVREARKLIWEIWDQRELNLWPSDEEVMRFVEYKVKPTHRIFGYSAH
ncbi:hypothetical protein FRC06_007114, partial [Ceratobasidium sp. 370]